MTKSTAAVIIKEVPTKINGKDYILKKPRLNFSDKNPNSVSKTHQSFAEESKMSSIMRNYRRTGILGDPLALRRPVFGDFTGQDFTTMQQRISEIKSDFEKMPGKIKDRFQNNPQNLIDFLANPDNAEEAIKLGLRQDPKRFEPYMLKDKNGVSTGVMRHPGLKAEDDKYYKDGKLSDQYGTLIVETPPPA